MSLSSAVVLAAKSDLNFALNLQVTWFSSQPISTAWTEICFPVHEYLTYLTTLLSRSIAASSYWFYRFMSYADSFANHLSLSVIRRRRIQSSTKQPYNIY